MIEVFEELSKAFEHWQEPFMERRNFAARAAHWSSGHWKTATAAWLVFVVVAVGLGTTFGTQLLSVAEQSTGETARAEQMLANAGFDTPAAESVLVRSSTRTVADPAFRVTMQRVLVKLRAMPQVTNLHTGACRPDLEGSATHS